MEKTIVPKKVEEKVIRPSYASSGQAREGLEIFKRVVPKKIDVEFIDNNKITTKSNAFRIIDLYRWFGLIDSEGNVIADKVAKLRLVGEERESFIKQLIQESYKELFAEVNIEVAKKDDIVNFFIRKHGYTHLQAGFATSLFISLCQEYKIPISENIRDKVVSSFDRQKIERKKQIKADKKNADKKNLDTEGNNSNEHSDNLHVGENKYVITIKSKDGKNHFFPINSLDDMEELEAILTIVKKRIS